MNRHSPIAVAIAALLSAACGSSSDPSESTSSTAGGPAAGQSVVVVTAPAETAVEPGMSVQFTAQVTGTADTSVKWMVDEADGGAIDATGLYTAPATEGTYHVRAEHPSQVGLPAPKGASGVVHVKKGTPAHPVAVAVSPSTAIVPAGGSRSFAAAVTGTTNLSVTWSVQPGSSCGSISAAGVYTAPPAGATCTVVATSAADPTRSGSATVTVTAPPPAVAVSITPATATLDACGTRTFSASVTNTSNTAVTWTVVEVGGGTVSSGAYVAPTIPGTYHVMAVSQADTSQSAQATITVGAEKVLAVAVVPGSGTVQANGTLAFAALVTTTCGTFAAQ